MNTNDIGMLKKELEQANKTIRELSRQIGSLSDELMSKDQQIAKYEDAKDVLEILLEAEKKAEQLERITNGDLAYDLWHHLRTATALMQKWVRPSLHVSICDTDTGMVTKYTYRGF